MIEYHIASVRCLYKENPSNLIFMLEKKSWLLPLEN